MENFKEQVSKIARDLTNLEINTITTGSIAGTKMPHPLHALLDIAKNFDSELIRQGVNRLAEHDDLGGYGAFDQIRRRANDRISEPAKEGGLSSLATSDLMMLYRVRDASDQIKGVFVSLKKSGIKDWGTGYTRIQVEEEKPVVPFTAADITLIRKIWELGTDEIAMQTVIQLDGDVVTRVQPKYAALNQEAIFKIHNQGVSTSISFWKELVEVLGAFLEAIVKKIF